MRHYPGFDFRKAARFPLSLVALATLTFLALPAQSQTVLTVGCKKDNTLFSDFLNNSDGAGPNVFAGNISGGGTRRALLAFDLSSIPANSVITAVTLTLHVSKTQAGDETVSMHLVQADWGEGTSNSGVNGGRGVAATTGDATWRHRFFNTSLWTTQGGDFTAAASASQTIGDIGFYTWASTPQLVADVQKWVNTPATNFGWILRGNEGADQTVKRFDSRQSTTAANRPVLKVTYNPAPVVHSVSGTVTLEGYLGSSSQDATFTLRPADNSGNIVIDSLIAANGAFSLTNIPANLYQLHIKPKKYLAANVDNVDVRSSNVSGLSAVTLAGDASNDNSVNFDDFQILADAYFTTQGVDALYDTRADFNGDGEVNFDDFQLLADNYFRDGAG